MATATIIDMQGKKVGDATLSDAVFAAAPKPKLVHQVAVGYLAAKRQGNHETKTRKDVSGTGRKPYAQKGTGNARHGSLREPQMRGGGTVFGPHKRSYRQKTPVQFKRLALCSMLSDRLRSEALNVLTELKVDDTKTKPFIRFVEAVASTAAHTLIVTGDLNSSAVLSARNLPRVTIRTAMDLNALDVLRAKHVLVEQSAVAKLEERLS